MDHKTALRKLVQNLLMLQLRFISTAPFPSSHTIYSQLNKIVGVKSASVGCVKLFFSVPGNMQNLIVIAATHATKMTKAKMKKILPMASRPSNLWGVADRTRAMPPVERGQVNWAQVKL